MLDSYSLIFQANLLRLKALATLKSIKPVRHLQPQSSLDKLQGKDIALGLTDEAFDKFSLLKNDDETVDNAKLSVYG